MSPLRKVSIFMEGGGRGRGRDVLRRGMTAFLQPVTKVARERELGFRVVACGSREETFRRFRREVDHAGPEETCVMLVDAEAPTTKQPKAHLRDNDGWDLSFARQETIHLMVQVMETWIVADRGAVADYYGADFKEASVPKHSRPEKIPKRQILEGLKEATRPTSKGVYKKIDHAADLLTRIDPVKVRDLCRHCRRLFEELGRIVEAA